MQFDQLVDHRLLYVFLVAALTCAAIILAFSMAPRRLRSGDSSAIQSAHSKPTPRIGGVALVGSLVVFAAFIPGSLLTHYVIFCGTLVPVFVAGLAEDLGRRVPPRYRLLAAMLSSLLVVYFFGTWLPRSDIFLIDALMPIAPFAIALTVFIGATACNSFNLIDGLNGMAGGTAVMTALGLSAIAMSAGEVLAAQAGLLMVAALAGFLLFNYPLGRIFLGDAGAYSIGHILIWLAIFLLARVEEISGVALLLVFFWPAADTIFSIYRRRLNRRAISQPDRLHFHQFVMRALEVIWLGRSQRHLANPFATAVLMPFVAMPILAGVAFWNNTPAAMLSLLTFCTLFVGSYTLGLRLAPRYRRVRSRTTFAG